MTEDHGRLYEAAIAAEQQTGTREATEQAARSHIIVRLGRMFVGTVLLLAGVVMMVLPGPGLLAILAGLSILAVDVPFAARLHRHLLDRADKATGFIPKRVRLPLFIGAGLLALIGGALASRSL